MKKGHMPSLVAMLRDTTCSVRDTRSAELISELHPVIIPDPVFLYTPRIKNKSTKRIGLALRQ
jgi:hypothetical protein